MVYRPFLENITGVILSSGCLIVPGADLLYTLDKLNSIISGETDAPAVIPLISAENVLPVSVAILNTLLLESKSNLVISPVSRPEKPDFPVSWLYHLLFLILVFSVVAE